MKTAAFWDVLLCIWQILTSVSEELTTTIIINVSARLHNETFQKTVIFKFHCKLWNISAYPE
jgi:uncharacterized membrane protein